MFPRLVYATLLACVSFGCSAGVGSEPSGYGDGSSNNLTMPDGCDEAPAFEDVSAFDTCVQCHRSTQSGAERKGAPSSINFDLEESASTHAHEAATMVRYGSMPPRASGLSLSEDQKQQLYDWVDCVL